MPQDIFDRISAGPTQGKKAKPAEASGGDIFDRLDSTTTSTAQPRPTAPHDQQMQVQVQNQITGNESQNKVNATRAMIPVDVEKAQALQPIEIQKAVEVARATTGLKTEQDWAAFEQNLKKVNDLTAQGWDKQDALSTVFPSYNRPPKPQADQPTAEEPSFFKRYISPLIPTPRQATQMVGGVIGGAASIPAYVTGPGGVAATALGGALGAAGAGGLYDIAEQLWTGKPKEPQIGTDMLAGALQEGAGPAAKALAGGIERSIPGSITRAVGPSGLKEKAAINEVAPALAKDTNFPVAATVGKLNEKVAAHVDDLTQQIESAWSRLPPTTKIPTAPTKFSLQQARGKLFNSNGTIIKGNEKLADELTGMIDYLGANPSFNPADLRKNRQLWDKLVNWYRSDALGASTEPEREEVYRLSANGLRDTINKSFPAISKLNEQISNYIPASKVLDKRDTMGTASTAAQQIRRLIPSAVGGSIGGTIGHLTGLGASEGATAGAALTALMNSTIWQTASIPVKKQVVQLLNKGMTQEAISLLTGLASTHELSPGTTVDLTSGDIH